MGERAERERKRERRGTHEIRRCEGTTRVRSGRFVNPGGGCPLDLKSYFLNPARRVRVRADRVLYDSRTCDPEPFALDRMRMRIH